MNQWSLATGMRSSMYVAECDCSGLVCAAGPYHEIVMHELESLIVMHALGTEMQKHKRSGQALGLLIVGWLVSQDMS